MDEFFNSEGMKGRSTNLLTVNLQCSDEQIIKDFRHWLTEYRRFTGYTAQKSNFTEKDLSDWVKWQLLPYIDLNLVAEIEGKEITQPTVAWLIFGNDADKVDIVDRLRRTTKKNAEWLMSDATRDDIEMQVLGMAKNT